METVTIYTDGACKGNPGPGGYGIVMLYKGKAKEFSGGFRKTTNNRMELLAVIIALESLKWENMQVIIYSDSKYVIDPVEKRWLVKWEKYGFKKNADLWRRYLLAARKNSVSFQWVKGHSTNEFNNYCDMIAVKASHTNNLPADTAYELQMALKSNTLIDAGL